RKVGAIGHMGSFSFQSSKNLNSGEGGLITTNDDQLAEKCRSIHNCGRIPGGQWYEHHVMSANYRLGEFAGAILNCQLDRLDEQPLFAQKNFGPYTASLQARPDLDYGKLNLPNCEAISGGEGAWMYQTVLLGSKEDMDDVVLAAEKVYAHRDALSSFSPPL